MLSPLSPSAWLLSKAFERRGYEVTRFDDPYLLELKKEGLHFFTNASKTPVQSSPTYFVCKNKYLTRQILRSASAPGPRFCVLKKNEMVGNKLSFPIVLKPLFLEGGKGVEVNIQSQQQVNEYYLQHPDFEEVLAEEMLTGIDIRVLIVAGKFFAAVKRIPARVIGNGKNTIRELIEIENEKRKLLLEEDREKERCSTDLRPIQVDASTPLILQKQGADFSTIPAKGNVVFLRENANVSTGGTTVDMTDNVCEEIRTECERIARSLCMSTVGLDIMVTDCSRSFQEQRGAGVIEVNASPALDIHAFVDDGISRDPSDHIVREVEQYFHAMR